MNRSDQYFVTGASGHLGSAILDRLRSSGNKTYALYRTPPSDEIVGVHPLVADVRDKEALEICFRQLDGKNTIVLHCAGIISIGSQYSQKMWDVNVEGTKHIADLCKTYAVKKLVYVSSVHAIPELSKGQVIRETLHFSEDLVHGPYAKTKAEGTAYVLSLAAEGFNVSVVHPSGMIGPFDAGKGHMNALVKAYYQGRMIFGVAGGYDFVDVRDVAAGVLAAAERGKRGECFILSNRYYQMKEIFRLLREITGKNKVIELPFWFVRPLSVIIERIDLHFNRKLMVTPYSLYTLQSNSNFSHEKAFTCLDYRTREMRTTLEDTISWLKACGSIQ